MAVDARHTAVKAALAARDDGPWVITSAASLGNAGWRLSWRRSFIPVFRSNAESDEEDDNPARKPEVSDHSCDKRAHRAPGPQS
jgi:hypothetical protein